MSENVKTAGDERLAKNAKEATNVRGDRVEEDASRLQEDGTATTMADRLAAIRNDWTNDVLPTPPKVAGWHYCWLSTTNSADPIYKRMQKGYEPVRISEIPGFAQYKVAQGEFEGCIACNEMLLFKIPEELYQEIMKIFHYERPMEEEEILRANAVDNVRQEDSNGRELLESEGFDSLARRVKPTTFS